LDFEKAFIEATRSWGLKVGAKFRNIAHPIYEGFKREDDDLVGNELQYYLNCATCKELVSYIRKSPNDKILVELIST
jgi:hypothetical protein